MMCNEDDASKEHVVTYCEQSMKKLDYPKLFELNGKLDTLFLLLGKEIRIELETI
jgi:hypothetical protein